MRLVFILPDLPLAGTAVRTSRWSVRAAGMGHDVTVLTITPVAAPSLVEELAAGGVRFIRLTRLSDLRGLAKAFAPGTRVEIFAALPTAGAIGAFLAAVTGAGFTYSVTNTLYQHRPFSILSTRDLIKRALEAQLLRRTALVHFVAESLVPQALATFPHLRSRVAAVVDSHGAPGAHGAEESLAKTGAPCRGLIAVCMGRLVPQKNVAALVRAAERLSPGWPLFRVEILGDGPQRPAIEALVRERGLTGTVVLHGAHPAVRAWLERADLLVLPSLYEGYSRAVAEAHSMGVPVVMIDTPAGREAALHGDVVLARPEDDDALAAAVESVLLRTERRGWAR